MLLTLLTTATLTSEGFFEQAPLASEKVVTNVTSTVQNFLTGIDWLNPSWDLFIILFFAIVALIYGFSLGRDRAIIIILAIYMSLAVVDYAPFLERLIQGTALADLFIFKAISFLVVFIILFFLLAQSALLNVVSTKHTRSWWQSIVFSCLQVGLLISIVLYFLPESFTSQLSEFTQTVFVSEQARFIWIIMPIILMILLRKAKRRPSREIDDYL
jgi:hypothetical protein